METNRGIRAVYRKMFEKKVKVLEGIRHQMMLALNIIDNYFR